MPATAVIIWIEVGEFSSACAREVSQNCARHGSVVKESVKLVNATGNECSG